MSAQGKLASVSAALGSNLLILHAEGVRQKCDAIGVYCRTLTACNGMGFATQGGALRACPGLACQDTFGVDVYASPCRVAFEEFAAATVRHGVRSGVSLRGQSLR